MGGLDDLAAAMGAVTKHVFDVDREAPALDGVNRCVVEAAGHGPPDAGQHTNHWRPPCNVSPRFVMVTLDQACATDAVYTVTVEARDLAVVTVAAGDSFARVEVDTGLGFGTAESLAVECTDPGTGYNSVTVATVLDAPPQWFLSGTLIFNRAGEELFTHVFVDEGGGGRMTGWTATRTVNPNRIAGDNNHPDDITPGTGSPPSPLLLTAGDWVLQDGNAIAVTGQATGYDVVEFPGSNAPLTGDETIEGDLTLSIHGTTVGTMSGGPAASFTADISPSGTFTSPGGAIVVTLDGLGADGTVLGSHEGEAFTERTGLGRMYSGTPVTGLEAIGFAVTSGDAIGGGAVETPGQIIFVGPVDLGYNDIAGYSLHCEYFLAGGSRLFAWNDDYPDFDPLNTVIVTTTGGSGSLDLGPYDVTVKPWIELTGTAWDFVDNPDDATDFVDITIVPIMSTRAALEFEVSDTQWDLFIRPA